MPIEISPKGEYEFVLTAFGMIEGEQQGEVDFYIDTGGVMAIKTLAFTLNVQN